MFSYRPVLLLSFAFLCWEVNVLAQTVPFQTQPMAQQRVQQQPVQQQPIQQQPIQASPFGAQGTSPYYNPPQPAAQTAAAQMPIGTNIQPPIRQVQAEQPLTLYNPGMGNQLPQTMQPTAVPPPAPAQHPPYGEPYAGRTAPVSRVTPFLLNPAEQHELDEFLARWERNSAGIKRYDVNFSMHEYDPTIPGAKPNEAARICFGYFKYIANPVRFVYVVEGEWRDGKAIKREGDKNPHIYAEKTIIAEKVVYKHDYNSKTIYQINIPPELVGKGIADSPLPLVFGAKADELKRRFSMKVVTTRDTKTNEDLIWLFARPLLIEDQQEFKELEVLIEKKDLRARALKQSDINDKTYKVFTLTDTKINSRLNEVREDLMAFFTPMSDRGWTTVVSDWNAPPSYQPIPDLGVPRPPVGNLHPYFPPQ